jgi:hypothetical protein
MSVPSKSKSSAAVWVGVAVAVVVVVALVAVIAAICAHKNDTTTSAPTASPTAPAGDISPTSTPTPTPPPDPEAAAFQQLQQFADSDHDYISSQLAAYWIPQLSSKRSAPPWTVDPDNNVTYDSVAILNEHKQLRDQYNAKLLWAGDWPTANFEAPEFWVTVAPVPAVSSADIKAWCARNNLDDDHCYAQNLNSGTTAHN